MVRPPPHSFGMFINKADFRSTLSSPRPCLRRELINCLDHAVRLPRSCTMCPNALPSHGPAFGVRAKQCGRGANGEWMVGRNGWTVTNRPGDDDPSGGLDCSR